MTTYAWTIDTDHVDAEFGDLSLRTPTGPRSAPDALVAQLEAGKGQKFRLLDDDGELLYSGRIVFATVEAARAALPEEAFGPLDDFGTPNAGATEIQYHLKGRWTSL